MSKTVAFSLIELLVVVAIISLISAIAVPAYQAYSGKAQLANLVSIQRSLLQDVQKIYESNGTMPTSITYKTTNLPANTWVYVGDTQNYIFGMYYGNSPTNGRGAFISISTTGIKGIPGYVAQTNTTTPYGNLYSEFMMAMIEINGQMRYACGSAIPSGSAYVPKSALPISCQCEQISNYFNQTPTWTQANSTSSFPGC